jgi:hypothetical protein
MLADDPISLVSDPIYVAFVFLKSLESFMLVDDPAHVLYLTTSSTIHLRQ